MSGYDSANTNVWSRVRKVAAHDSRRSCSDQLNSSERRQRSNGSTVYALTVLLSK